jgi:hypothetical protein
MATAIAAAFLPLMAAGVLDDFVNALQIARYGARYNHTNWFSFYSGFKLLFWDGWTTPFLTSALVVLGTAGPVELRRPARTWLLALVGALCYQPISPVPHGYLLLPLRLMQSIAVAPIAAWFLNRKGFSPSVRLAGLIVLVATGVPGRPRFCTARGSLETIGPLARGGIPAKAPPGCRDYYPVVTRLESRDGLHCVVSYDYWADYRRVLLFLRRELDRRRPVASLLRSLPIPAVNGPSGHLSPFPAGGGCMHLFLVDPSLEGRFIEALERTPGTVVVWTPDDPAMSRAMQFPRLEAAVRCWYRPCERYGHIEVWVRSDERAGCRCQTSGDGRSRVGP